MLETYCWQLIDKAESLDNFVISDGNGFRDHIVLCTFGYDIVHFLCTARLRHLNPTEIRPILILASELPTPSEFENLSSFPEVYYMVGNPYDIKSLIKANIIKAHKIVLLGLSDGYGSEIVNSELVDSPTMYNSL